MNLSSQNHRRIVAQQGAILPVVLLLGMGLMIGIAGVVNLGFVQDDLAKAERAAIDSAIATQFLVDHQQKQMSLEGNASGPLIPFPSTTQFHDILNLGADESCFAEGARAQLASDYRPASKRFRFGQQQPSYSIGEITPVIQTELNSMGAWESEIEAIDLPSDNKHFFLSELAGRDIRYIQLASGTNNRIELRRLGETDVDRFFAHIWFRLSVTNLASSALPVSAPLFTHAASATSATPNLQWIVTASAPEVAGGTLITGASSGNAIDLHMDLKVGSTGTTGTAVTVQDRSDNREWHAASLWFSGPDQEVWAEIRHRGSPSSSIPDAISLSNVDVEIGRNSEFFVGSASANTATGFLSSSSAPIDIATVRVWLEPPIATSATAQTFADNLFEMDTYRPGGRFEIGSGPPALNLTIASAPGEPDSYVVLDSEGGNGLVDLGGNEFLISADWQPLFGQPVAIGSASLATIPDRIGGNASATEPLRHGGPPSDRNYYVFHSCDENGYQFVERVRRFTRGAGTDDQQVEWFEE